MKKEDVRPLIVAEWLELPPMQRATIEQARDFAREHEYDYTFKTTGGRDKAILFWISQHLPNKPNKLEPGR